MHGGSEKEYKFFEKKEQGGYSLKITNAINICSPNLQKYAISPLSKDIFLPTCIKTVKRKVKLLR